MKKNPLLNKGQQTKMDSPPTSLIHSHFFLSCAEAAATAAAAAERYFHHSASLQQLENMNWVVDVSS